MASSSFITEFGKKPPMVKAGAFIAIGLVLGALYWQLVYSGLRRDLQAAEETRGALVADEETLTREEKEFTTLKEKQDVLETMIKENDTALPTAAQLPSFFDMLNRKVGEANVDVRRWVYLKEAQVEETIFKVPVEIEIQGTFYEIKKFFHLLYRLNLTDQQAADETGASPETAADVEERDRILTIEDLVIGDPVVRNNELSLTATFRASTFRKEVPAEEPAPADDKTKAGAGARKTPTQQAKDKTEGAMDRSDDRARKAGGEDSPVPAEKEGADRVKGGM